jgi:hypothetical protein
LDRKLEKIRDTLNKKIDKLNLNDKTVITLSCRLDEEILGYYRSNYKRSNHKKDIIRSAQSK